MDCMRFYAQYGGDGRNHTARSVYECFFDPNNGVCDITYSKAAKFNTIEKMTKWYLRIK